jgi:hypothetical protein
MTEPTTKQVKLLASDKSGHMARIYAAYAAPTEPPLLFEANFSALAEALTGSVCAPDMSALFQVRPPPRAHLLAFLPSRFLHSAAAFTRTPAFSQEFSAQEADVLACHPEYAGYEAARVAAAAAGAGGVPPGSHFITFRFFPALLSELALRLYPAGEGAEVAPSRQRFMKKNVIPLSTRLAEAEAEAAAAAPSPSLPAPAPSSPPHLSPPRAASAGAAAQPTPPRAAPPSALSSAVLNLSGEEEEDSEARALRGSPVIATAAAAPASPPRRAASPHQRAVTPLLGAGGVAGAVFDDLEGGEGEEEEEEEEEAPLPPFRGGALPRSAPPTPSGGAARAAYRGTAAAKVLPPSPFVDAYAGVPSRYMLPPSPRGPPPAEAPAWGGRPLEAGGVEVFLKRQAAAAEAKQAKVLALLANDDALAAGAGTAAEAMSSGSRAIVERKAASGVPRHQGVGGGGEEGGGGARAPAAGGEALYAAALAQRARHASADAATRAAEHAARNAKRATPTSDAIMRRRLGREVLAGVVYCAAARAREAGSGAGGGAAPTHHASLLPWWCMDLTPSEVAALAQRLGLFGGEHGSSLSGDDAWAAVANWGGDRRVTRLLPAGGAPLPLSRRDAATGDAARNLARLWHAATEPGAAEGGWAVLRQGMEGGGGGGGAGGGAGADAALFAAMSAAAAAHAAMPPVLPAVRLLALLQALVTGAYDVRPSVLCDAATALGLGSHLLLVRPAVWAGAAAAAAGGSGGGGAGAAAVVTGAGAPAPTTAARGGGGTPTTPFPPPAPTPGAPAQAALSAALDGVTAALRSRLLPSSSADEVTEASGLSVGDGGAAPAPSAAHHPLAAGVLEARATFSSDLLAPLRPLYTNRLAFLTTLRRGDGSRAVALGAAADVLPADSLSAPYPPSSFGGGGGGGGGGGVGASRLPASAPASVAGDSGVEDGGGSSNAPPFVRREAGGRGLGTGPGSEPAGGGGILRSRAPPGRGGPEGLGLLDADCTFAPLLCARSLSLAAAAEARAAASGPRELHLLQYKAGVEARNKQLRLARDAAELSECTFKPALNRAPLGVAPVYMPNYSSLLAAARGAGGGGGGGEGSSPTTVLRSAADAAAAAASATAAGMSGSRHEWLYHLASLKNAALSEAAALAAAARRAAEEEGCTFRPAPPLPPPPPHSQHAAPPQPLPDAVHGAKGHIERAARARAERCSKAEALAALSLGVLRKSAVVRDEKGLTITKPFKAHCELRASASAAAAASAGGGGGGGGGALSSSASSAGDSGAGSAFLARPGGAPLDSSGLYDPVTLDVAPRGGRAPPPASPPPRALAGALAGTFSDTAPPSEGGGGGGRSVSFARSPPPAPPQRTPHSAATPLVFQAGEPPLLYVDVTVAAGNVERLPVWKDSDLSAVAAGFAEKHELPRKMARKLEKLMAEQRDAILIVARE